MCYWHSVLYHYLKHRSFNLIVVPLSTLDLAWIHSCRSLYTRISQVADNELAAEIRVYYVRFTDELYKSAVLYSSTMIIRRYEKCHIHRAGYFTTREGRGWREQRTAATPIMCR